MSDWIHVTGYMVVGDGVPCKIGKKYKEDMENDMTPTGEMCGITASAMLGKILITLRSKWKYFCDKPYNPFEYSAVNSFINTQHSKHKKPPAIYKVYAEGF